MSRATIRLDGCSVRIICGPEFNLGVPKRQSSVWETDARSYAERLSTERGWLIEVSRGATG
jgi:hypothetical protein